MTAAHLVRASRVVGTLLVGATLVSACGAGGPEDADDHDVLVDVMAGVEDIPGVVMVDGLPWTWETFPEFLDAVDARRAAGRDARQQHGLARQPPVARGTDAGADA